MADVEAAAETACDVVRELGGDDLVAAGYYTEDGAELVFRRDAVQETFSGTGIEEVLDSARLESIAQVAYEAHHEQRLSATIRAYEDVADVLIPVEEYRGVALTLDYYGTHSFQTVLEAIEEALTAETVGVDLEPLRDVHHG